MEGNNRKILLSLSNNGIAISYLQDGMIPVINCCGHKSLSSLLKDMRNNDINCELKTDYGEYIVLKNDNDIILKLNNNVYLELKDSQSREYVLFDDLFMSYSIMDKYGNIKIDIDDDKITYTDCLCGASKYSEIEVLNNGDVKFVRHNTPYKYSDI